MGYTYIYIDYSRRPEAQRSAVKDEEIYGKPPGENLLVVVDTAFPKGLRARWVVSLESLRYSNSCI